MQCRDTAIADPMLELGRSHKVSMKKLEKKLARAKEIFVLAMPPREWRQIRCRNWRYAWSEFMISCDQLVGNCVAGRGSYWTARLG